MRMISLGLEGTAHTISCGIVDEKDILANSSSVYVPEKGGIHPREAANHHLENVIRVIKGALESASLSMKDIDLIGFSRGPGLGPCLRVAATAARSLSLRWGKPILGVNHPLGHVEIGRMLSGAKDPVMLYVSGGNTQVIAHRSGRYRVFGETMDIGLGNMLDKFARNVGIPFPGGPEIEKIAEKGKRIVDLPYSVRGMDTSFSGIMTAAMRHLETGTPLDDVSFSLQEVSFSMLVEVLERALYHLNKDEILLAGGVARNRRLRNMVRTMSEQAGVKAYLTDPAYCMDNGAMIARAAFLMYSHGERHSIADTGVDQRFRIDEVSVPWILPTEGISFREKGAEADVERTEFFGRKAIVKTRLKKKYRVEALDNRIRMERTRSEYTILRKMDDSGIPVPLVYDIDPDGYVLTMQRIEGQTLRDFLNSGHGYSAVLPELGRIVARMHDSRISHGDLTTSNMIVEEKLYLIDPSMGKYPAEVVQMAHDLFLLLESFKSSHSDLPDLKELFMEEYRKGSENPEPVMKELRAIEARRRYV